MLRPRPAPHKRASRPPTNFMVLFLSIKAIIETPAGKRFFIKQLLRKLILLPKHIAHTLTDNVGRGRAK